MSQRPTSSSWADGLSDELDQADTSRLLRDPVSSYHATQSEPIRDHEAGLDRLGEAIKRQKYMANGLATEVDLHNEILDDIDRHMTTTTANLQKNTRNIKLLSKKSSTCLLWSIIVILAIVILVLAIL